MTKGEIEAVLDRVRSWPADRQEEAAMILLQMEAVDLDPVALSLEDRAAILEGLAQCERGEFASDEEVEVLFSRYRSP